MIFCENRLPADQQTILVKYDVLFVIFEEAANMKWSSAANYR